LQTDSNLLAVFSINCERVEMALALDKDLKVAQSLSFRLIRNLFLI
jgi:hypothetical protein